MKKKIMILLLAFYALLFVLLAPAKGTEVGGRISSDTTWTLAESPYIVTSSVRVYGTSTQTVTLTIEAGVEVKFNSNTYLEIATSTSKGALSAIGTSANPITFTSNQSTPQRGDWYGIRFQNATVDSQTRMEYCIVEYGGYYSAYGNIYTYQSGPTFSNCTIRYSKYDGIRCNLGSPTIEGGAITDNNQKGIYDTSTSTITINNTSFSNNGSYAMSVHPKTEIITSQGISASPDDRVEIRAGTQNIDITWRNLGIPFYISGNINVYKNSSAAATLTIEPGAEIRFKTSTYLYIGHSSYKGALWAVGTEQHPITFTSNQANPQPGSWGAIRFENQTDDPLTRMEHCIVEYGGVSSAYGSIYFNQSGPTLENCTIRYSKYDGIRCYMGSPTIEGGEITDNNQKGIYDTSTSTITINNTSFSNNGSYAMSVHPKTEIITSQGISASPDDRVEIRAGTQDIDITWRDLGVPYYVPGNINIRKNASTTATLTIEPGVEVRFNTSTYLYIGSSSYKGALSAVGTPEEPITFTSNQANPQPGDWGAVRFESKTDDALTKMEYCIVEYGCLYSSQGSIMISYAEPKISNCVIRYSQYNGIQISGSNPEISFCTIEYNNKGIYSANSQARINHCNISNNVQFGIENISSSKLVDARFNWWDHSSGPSGQGPGSGDAVSEYVYYEPWLWSEYSHPYHISSGTSSTKELTVNGGLSILSGITEEETNWTILIVNTSQQTVKTFTDTGIKIIKSWDGKDEGGSPLPPGTYSYQIYAERQSDQSEATPLLGLITLNPDFPVSYISSPAPYDSLGGTIEVIGSANDPDFSNYKLEYGQSACPSSWTLITESTSPVTDGTLGSLDTSGITAETITFKLTVNDTYDNTSVSLISVNISFIYNFDVSPNPFSPNDDQKKDTTTFSAQFQSESDWTLEIYDPTGQNVIRTFSGSGESMSQEWDGKNEIGEAQSSETYPYELSVTNPSLPEPALVNGSVILDVTPPTAQITDPTEEELFSNIYGTDQLDVIGTASDENFLNYLLEYGETYNPTSWHLIASSDTSVTDGLLGNLDTIQLNNGEHTIKLTVEDKADNVSSTEVHIRVGNLKMNISSHELNIAMSETVTIASDIPFTVTNTIVIKDKDLNIRKTIIEDVLRNGGVYNDVWDGKDDGGLNLPQDAYYVISTVVTQDQVEFTLDLTDTGGEQEAPDKDYPDNFSPFEGESAELTFTLSEPYEIEFFIRSDDITERTRNFFERDPLPSGNYTIYWDGTDDNGFFMNVCDNLVVLWSYTIPDNGVVVYGERPEINSLSLNTHYFRPDDENFPDGLEITYSISKSSDVTIFIHNNDGTLIKSMNPGSQSSGYHTVYWDGRTNTGDLAEDGSYRIGVVAEDTIGNSSLIRYCLVWVYY